MVQFLNCMESTVESVKGKFDPPLSTVMDTSQKSPQEAASADAAKAKIKFPWHKKEAVCRK